MSEIQKNGTPSTDSKKASRFRQLPKKKKIQLVVASSLTAVMMVAIPVYSWFTLQRKTARYERINSPDTLYLTAANREDTIYLKMDRINVKGYWYDDNNEQAGRVGYKYYVFSVAGEYVTNYDLQLAHTQNNPYQYEIFEAKVSKTKPDGVVDKDYVTYTVQKDYPDELPDIDDHLENVKKNDVLYYSIKTDDSSNHTPISLNAKSTNPLAASTYTVGSNTSYGNYNGHYLNMQTTGDDAGLANSDYHSNTYDYNHVEKHAEPLYWQATGIEVDGASGRDPFYHEYILKVTWDASANLDDLAKYKDTDIIYITAAVK